MGSEALYGIIWHRAMARLSMLVAVRLFERGLKLWLGGNPQAASVEYKDSDEENQPEQNDDGNRQYLHAVVSSSVDTDVGASGRASASPNDASHARKKYREADAPAARGIAYLQPTTALRFARDATTYARMAVAALYIIQ
ncbi:MAG: hypothetical protein OJF49_003436 [Ktedonobacterales bacterium]|nr:MAG: hypothetical protein OJF49_003436 [Ktedonobacterales bacterium]